MKTKIINISLLAIFALLSLNVSAASMKIIRNNKSGILTSATKEVKVNDMHIKRHLLDSKEFNNNSVVFANDEIQIEDWMTTEFSNISENKNSLKQNPNLKEMRNHSFPFSKVLKSFDVEPEIVSWMYESK